MSPVHDKRPAHRPSRRKEIIAAATKTFFRDGYVEARMVAAVEKMCISLLMSLADQSCHGSASWVTSIS